MMSSREKAKRWACLAVAVLVVGVAKRVEGGVILSPGQALGLSQATPLNLSGLTAGSGPGPESPNEGINKVVSSGIPSNTNTGVVPSNQGTSGSALNTGSGIQAGSQFSGGAPKYSAFNFNTGFNTGYNTGFNNQFHDPFGVMCPTQVDLTRITLSSDTANYPVGNITTELENRPQFAEFLLQEIVLPDEPGPAVPMDPRFDDAPPACPQQLDRLWSYLSTDRQSRCWVMQNFQEVILYATCLTEFCQHCGDKFTSSFDSKRNLCAKTYQVISVWSYCEALPLNSRIVRDRITIPAYCSCKKVQCMTNNIWNK